MNNIEFHTLALTSPWRLEFVRVRRGVLRRVLYADSGFLGWSHVPGWRYYVRCGPFGLGLTRFGPAREPQPIPGVS